MIKPIQRIYRIIYGLSCLKIYLNDFEKICIISTRRVLLPIRCARRSFAFILSFSHYFIFKTFPFQKVSFWHEINFF